MHPTPVRSPAALALALLALLPAREAPRYEFPASPVARAWAGVGPETRPLAPPDLPAAGAPRWEAWRADLQAERAAASPDAERRARLALLARAQGRHADAWVHAAACLAQPGRLAGLVPLLLPGAASAGPLPDGALLRPALPPRNEADPWGRSTMAVERLALGAARLDVRVTADPDGVQVEVAHAGGEAVRCRIALPEPDAFEIRIVYVDWLRQDDVAGPYELELAPGDEPRVVFGRFAPRAAPWTSELPVERLASLERDGLRVELAGLDDAARAELAGLGAALGALLAARVDVREVDPRDPPRPFPGLRVRLEPDTWRRELAAIVSSVERYVLRDSPAARAGAGADAADD